LDLYARCSSSRSSGVPTTTKSSESESIAREGAERGEGRAPETRGPPRRDSGEAGDETTEEERTRSRVQFEQERRTDEKNDTC